MKHIKSILEYNLYKDDVVKNVAKELIDFTNSLDNEIDIMTEVDKLTQGMNYMFKENLIRIFEFTLNDDVKSALDIVNSQSAEESIQLLSVIKQLNSLNMENIKRISKLN